MQIPPREDSTEFTACYWGRVGLTEFKLLFRFFFRTECWMRTSSRWPCTWSTSKLTATTCRPNCRPTWSRLQREDSNSLRKDILQVFRLTLIQSLSDFTTDESTQEQLAILNVKKEERRLFVLFKTYTSSVFLWFNQLLFKLSKSQWVWP